MDKWAVIVLLCLGNGFFPCPEGVGERSVTFLVKSLLTTGLCVQGCSLTSSSPCLPTRISCQVTQRQGDIRKPILTASANCFQPKLPNEIPFWTGYSGIDWFGMEGFLKHQLSDAAWQRVSVARCDCCFLIHLPTLYSWAFEWLPEFPCHQTFLHCSQRGRAVGRRVK